MLQFPRVLVIDDDASFGTALSTWLEDLGYLPSLETTAAAAASRISSSTFDLILLDLHLPDIPGHAVLRQLQRSGTGVPVVVMSGSAAMDDVVRAWRENAADFLKKPFEIDQLSAALDRALSSRAKSEPSPSPGVPEAGAQAGSAQPDATAASDRGPRSAPEAPSAQPQSAASDKPAPKAGDGASTANAPAARTAVRPAIARLREALRKGTATLAMLDPQVGRLQELLSQEDVSMRKVAAVVGCDGALTVGVLRVANSAHYSRGTSVDTVLEACVRIGPKRVMGIAHELALKDQFAIAAEPFHSALKNLWRNSVATSRAAAELARMLSRKDADDIQVAALLHNIGEQCLMRVFAELAGGPDEMTLEVIAEEVSQKHEDFGQALAKSWKLPPLAARLAGFHHRPARGGETVEHERVRHIVLLGWKLALMAGFTYLPGQDAPDIDESLAVLELTPADVEPLVKRMTGWNV